MTDHCFDAVGAARAHPQIFARPDARPAIGMLENVGDRQHEGVLSCLGSKA
jgi:hypothetical protein